MFEFVKNERDPNFPLMKTYPTTASEVYSFGEGLALTAGKLTKCAATAKPAYIAAKNYTAPATGNVELPVYPVYADTTLRTQLSADGAALSVGAAVTIDTDAMKATATTTSGVFTIEAFEDTSKGSGSFIIGRFK